jgi:hypothetical protein
MRPIQYAYVLDFTTYSGGLLVTSPLRRKPDPVPALCAGRGKFLRQPVDKAAIEGKLISEILIH